MRSERVPRWGWYLLTTLAGLCSEFSIAAPQVKAHRTETAPKIDGKLDDEIWAKIPPLTGFTQREPNQGAPGTERTEVRIAFDNRHLYFAFRCFDSQPELIRRPAMQRDEPMGGNDNIFVQLDPFRTEKDGFFFQINPNGARLDGKQDSLHPSPQLNWDGIWDGAGAIDELGWTAEMAIPFRSLNYDPNSLVWNINFGRWIPRKQEELRWTAASRSRNSTTLVDAGQLVGLEGLTRGLGVDLKPYSTLRWRDIGKGRGGDVGWDFEAGGDIFYQVTPSLTAVLTINTDFAETEVDQRRVNLTRFPLFFPEKRDFFLEGAEFFQFGTAKNSTRAFHSRTIGLSPEGEKVGIPVGVKVTGREGRLGVGIFGAGLEELGALESDEVFVGRFTYDLFDESRVGALLTHGDPRGNGDNTVAGLDLHLLDSHFIDDNRLNFRTWGLISDADGVTGENLGLDLNYSGEPIIALFKAEQVGDDYDPGTGFVQRTGRLYRAFFRYRWFPDPEWFHSFQLGIDESWVTTTENELETSVFEPGQVSVQLLSGDRLFFTPQFRREVLFEDFEIRDGVVVPVGDYSTESLRFSASGSNARTVSPFLRGVVGEFFGGDRLMLQPGITWRQSRFFKVDLGATYNDIALPGGEFETLVGSVGLEIKPSPRLSLNVLAQWDTVSDEMGINSRVRWIVKPGQDVFFVVNQGLDIEDRRFRSIGTETVAKVGLTFRY